MNKQISNQTKEAMIGVSIFLLYMFLQFFRTLPLEILNVNIEKVSLTFKVIYSLATEFFLLGIIIFILKDKLKENFVDFKNKSNYYFKHYFKYWLLAIGLMVVSNAFIMIFTSNDLSGNEEAIRNVFDKAPVYMFISAVFFAPIVEELIFRQGFRMCFKSDIVFITLSGLVFGSLHVFSTIENITDFLYLIPYSIPGFIFAYVLTKSKNIFVPISLHFIHNGIMMSLQVFLLLFG